MQVEWRIEGLVVDSQAVVADKLDIAAADIPVVLGILVVGHSLAVVDFQGMVVVFQLTSFFF